MNWKGKYKNMIKGRRLTDVESMAMQFNDLPDVPNDFYVHVTLTNKPKETDGEKHEIERNDRNIENAKQSY